MFQAQFNQRYLSCQIIKGMLETENMLYKTVLQTSVIVKFALNYPIQIYVYQLSQAIKIPNLTTY